MVMPKISRHGGASFEEAPVRIRRAEVESPVEFVAKKKEPEAQVDSKKDEITMPPAKKAQAQKHTK